MSKLFNELQEQLETEYKGFLITEKNEVYKAGKRVFTSHYFPDLDNAKSMIDVSEECKINQQRLSVFSPFPQDEEFENGVADQERFEHALNEYYELHINDNSKL